MNSYNLLYKRCKHGSYQHTEGVMGWWCCICYKVEHPFSCPLMNSHVGWLASTSRWIWTFAGHAHPKTYSRSYARVIESFMDAPWSFLTTSENSHISRLYESMSMQWRCMPRAIDASPTLIHFTGFASLTLHKCEEWVSGFWDNHHTTAPFTCPLPLIYSDRETLLVG